MHPARFGLTESYFEIWRYEFAQELPPLRREKSQCKWYASSSIEIDNLVRWKHTTWGDFDIWNNRYLSLCRVPLMVREGVINTTMADISQWIFEIFVHLLICSFVWYYLLFMMNTQKGGMINVPILVSLLGRALPFECLGRQRFIWCRCARIAGQRVALGFAGRPMFQ